MFTIYFYIKSIFLRYFFRLTVKLFSAKNLPAASCRGAPWGRPGGPAACPLAVGVLCAAPARRLGLVRPAWVRRRAKTHKYALCCAIAAWDPAAKLDFPSPIPRFFPFPSPAHPRASNAPIPVKKVQHGMENPYFPGMRRLPHCGCRVSCAGHYAAI